MMQQKWLLAQKFYNNILSKTKFQVFSSILKKQPTFVFLLVPTMELANLMTQQKWLPAVVG